MPTPSSLRLRPLVTPLVFALATLLACLVPRVAFAAEAAAPKPTAAEDEKVASDSPRAALADYLALCKADHFDRATKYLELKKGEAPADAARIAHDLDAVIRRRIAIDLDEVSPLSLGNPNDGLPPGIDDLGRIPAGAGASNLKGEPLRLVRRADDSGAPTWQFSYGTVERVPKWYDGLEDHWLRERVPEVWFREGPRDLLYWQWLALPFLVGAALLIGFILTRALRPLFDRILPKTAGENASSYRERLRAPARLLIALGAFSLAVSRLALEHAAESVLWNILRTTFHLTLVWFVVRIVDTATQNAHTSEWGRARPAAAGLMPLVGKLVKIAFLILGTVAILSELGYPVASIVAGLGIGGLAVALAAQKTVENLFGGVSIGIDQPFRIGDYVSVDGISGTVEGLGLRSTRIRTLDRTVVTIPNGKLAEMRIENFTSRDRFRFNAILPLAPNTSHELLAKIVADTDAHIREMPAVWPDAVEVIIKEFTKDSVNLEVSAAFVVKDATAFRPVRLALNLRLADIVASAGVSFAVPRDPASNADVTPKD